MAAHSARLGGVAALPGSHPGAKPGEVEEPDPFPEQATAKERKTGRRNRRESALSITLFFAF